MAKHFMIQKAITYIKENFSVKFFLSFTLVMLLMSSILATIFIRHQTRLLRNHLVHHGRLVTDMLAYNTRLGVFSENSEMLEDVTGGALRQEHVLAVIVHNKAHEILLLKTNHPNPERIKSLLHPPKATEFPDSAILFETKEEFEFQAGVFSRPPYMDILSPYLGIQAENQKRETIGRVTVIVSKKALNQQNQLLFAVSVGIAVFFWLAGSGLMFTVIRGITNPLNRLTQSVDRMGRKGRIRKLSFKTKDEVGRLADAFNNMSDAIKQRELEKAGLEEQLRQAQKMEAIGTLAGGIAHDFNNILGAIHGFAELGMMEAPKGSVLNEKLQEIDNATDRAADLVKQILTFSRQKDDLQSPVFVGTITKEVLKLLVPSIPSSIKIIQDIHPDCGMVLSNATTIHQIIMNLCTNAIHAMKKSGGTLTMKLQDVDVAGDKNAHKKGVYFGHYQKLTVQDEGHGIPVGILDQIFDPFFTTKGAGEGTGMGLSVVHGIVKRHNGFIQVASTPDKGSTFDVYLPLVDLEVIPEVPRAHEQLPTGTGNILLVEDDAQLAESTRGILASLGYQVEKKTSSLLALEFFKQRWDTVDLVITDMAMPEMTGVELAMKIREIKSRVPILITTGYSGMMNEKKARAMGLDGFLVKPIKRRTLGFVVKKILKTTSA